LILSFAHQQEDTNLGRFSCLENLESNNYGANLTLFFLENSCKMCHKVGIRSALTAVTLLMFTQGRL